MEETYVTAEEIKNSIEIADVISRYVALHKSGKNMMGLCPFHSERTPSFSVHIEKQFFRCFGCGTAGDVINFIMLIEKVEFKEACTILRSMIDGETTRAPVRKPVKISRKLPPQRLDEISRSLQKVLTLSDDHKRMLQSPERGMSEKEIAIRGYRSYPEKPWEPLKKMGYENYEGFPGAYLKENKKGDNVSMYWTLKSFGHSGILIPIYNHYNYIVGWQFRLDKVPNVASFETPYPNRFSAWLGKDGEISICWDGEIISKLPETDFLNENGEPNGKTKSITITLNGKMYKLGEVGIKKGQKYKWLSSGSEYKGTEANNPLPIHVAVPCNIREKSKPGQLIKAKRCWITEGPIKADKSSEICNEVILGIPGLTSWRYVLDVIDEMEVEHLILAFDMDIARKKELRNQVKLLKEELYKRKRIKQCDIALWSEEKHGKGLDDMLLNNHFPQIRNLFKKVQ